MFFGVFFINTFSFHGSLRNLKWEEIVILEKDVLFSWSEDCIFKIAQPGILSLGNKENSGSSRLRLMWDMAPQQGSTITELFTFFTYEQVSML